MSKTIIQKAFEPIPWDTYPAVNFLRFRSFENKKILEFGGGQSTLWWAKRAERIVTFEGDKAWFKKIELSKPSNVNIFLVPDTNPTECRSSVLKLLESGRYGKFDIVIIDELFRVELIDIARKFLADSGAIICDNAESYGFFDALKGSGLSRVDFLGHAPGVVLPHCTSIYFNQKSFLFSSGHNIPDIAQK